MSLAVALQSEADSTLNGNNDEALAAALKGSELASGLKRSAAADLILSQIARASGNDDPARKKIADDALARAVSSGADPGVAHQAAGERLAVETEVALERRNHARQRELLPDLIAFVNSSPWTVNATRLRLMAGRLLLSLGHPSDAQRELRVGAAVARRFGLGGVSEAHQSYWLRELSFLALASCGASLECGQIGAALDDLARARMVLLSSPTAEIDEGRKELSRRNRGITMDYQAAPAKFDESISPPPGKRLILLVPGDEHGWCVTISSEGNEIRRAPQLSYDDDR